MIIWDPVSSQFQRVHGHRSQAAAMPYVEDRAAALAAPNRPWGDNAILAAAPPPLDLAHLVAFADIEEMVVNWLNNPVGSFTHFIDASTTLFTPGWADVFNPARLARFLQQRAQMYFYRLLLLARRGAVSYNDIATASNQFVTRLNISEFNLRGGDRSTNRSIGRFLDPRMDNGYTLDPVSLMGRALARLMGTVAFSSETSLAMSHFPSQLSIVPATGAVRASTEGQVVTYTGSGNAVRGVARRPIRNYLRRHIWFIPFAEVGTVISLLIYYFFLTWLYAYFRGPQYD